MSEQSTNPFADLSFWKWMDPSKAAGEYKIPNFNFDAVMSAQRRNVEAFSALNKAVFESWQSLARRQADAARQSFEEANSFASSWASCPTAEEKAIRQAEASKAAFEKCLTNLRDVAETVAKCNNQALETVSTRVSESVQEVREIIKGGKAA
ncbi:MAG: phasin family protein [Alphaproteobacteria bacterium]|nr:phasin family protein [Alphaproteobacteria bacterium]